MPVQIFRKSMTLPSSNPSAVRFAMPNPFCGVKRPGYVGNDALYNINDKGEEGSSAPDADGGYEQFTPKVDKGIALCSPGGQSGSMSYAVPYQE